MALMMALYGLGPLFQPTVVVHAQAAPVGSGFTLDAGDLRFIYQQILVAQDHAAGGQLFGPGPNQVADPQLPRGLRTVDGSFNNIVPSPDRHMFGAADRLFPRMTTPVFRPAEALPFDPDGAGPQAAGDPTSYAQKSGLVSDSQPRVISNLIVDQSADNPAAAAAAANPCGSGGFVCSGPTPPDPDSGALFIPNITPDFGLSAPFNLMFTFFGQFFDHGLDLVTKGGGTVIMPLQPDDPLFVPGSPTNFMVMTRGQNQPGQDGILGTADDVQEQVNETTPFVDQNQTYTSHPSHQVFLRQYVMNALGRPVGDGKVLDGGACSPRGTGIPGDEICNVGNWAEVKAQAATKLGIRLTDPDVLNVPLILTDPYGHFKPGPRGFPQLVLPGNVLLEGDPAANAGAGVDIPATAFRTGHAFLNDIAHNAAPGSALVPDSDTAVCDFRTVPSCQPPGTYDDELLNLHFITGDGRGNENIALTAVHNIFHAEHNRLVSDIDQLIPQVLTPEEVAAWHAVHAGSGWDYGERLFQAARFVTEMEYQHLVFEEFARKIQPLINPFTVYVTSLDPAIVAEFAHTVYRLGHSMLPEVLGRSNTDGTANDIRLLNAFLNPVEYNNGGLVGPLPAAAAAGSLIRGLSQQVGNELDEFVTASVRNTLVGLPLDLPAINIARGRSEGVPPLNEARRQFFAATRDATVQPYANWFEFGLALRHFDSLVNFVAAYGTDPTITSATTVAAKRAAAQAIVSANGPLMFAPAATSGLHNVDFWVGGLAEKPAVFSGLLGSTFNFVFEKQLENLQDGDRFYYLQRTDGLNLKTQLEGNSLAEITRRNTDFQGGMDVIFNTADFNLDAAAFAGTAPVVLDPLTGISVLTLADGTKFFFDPLHTGKNIVFNGTAIDDRLQADVGDDTMYGNGGNDRLSGAEGNDTLHGGDGDDILMGGNGDDVLKGGPGNDALNSGPGFGGDLNLGGDGNDFIVDGPDTSEVFAGPGNDVIVDGDAATEGLVGNSGDDWIEGWIGHDANMFGDNGNFFDLLAGLDPIGGDDVFDGGQGQDNHFGEGGDDLTIQSEGTDVFLGLTGFDWVTQRGNPSPGNIELRLSPFLAGLNLNDTRDKYLFVDGASGWDLDDQVRGDDNSADPATPLERLLTADMALTAAGAAKITGLTELMGLTGFDKPLPFIGGNILLGGGGRDILEGKAGNDLIDGDRWLDVQLEATLNDGTVKLVNTARDLIDDVFADPQRLNPGHIRIVRTIRVGAPNLDTAVFSGNLAEYTITLNANGSVTVAHNGPGSPNPLLISNDGTDTVVNVEVLKFADTAIAAPGANIVAVPDVTNLTQAAATNALTDAGLTLGAIATAFSDVPPIVPSGSVISSRPVAGTFELPGTAVALFVSLGSTDVTAPTVSVTTPTSGATVSGTTTVSADAVDPVTATGAVTGVAGVQFLLDGAALGAEDTVAPYSLTWDTTTAANGTHTLAARARDAAGNVATSAAVSVTVNNAPPAPAETITIALAQFRANGGRLRVEGTIAPAAGQTMTIQVLNGAGTVVRTNTVPVARGGRWRLNATGVTLPVGALSVRVTSSNGTVATAPLVRRR